MSSQRWNAQPNGPSTQTPVPSGARSGIAYAIRAIVSRAIGVPSRERIPMSALIRSGIPAGLGLVAGRSVVVGDDLRGLELADQAFDFRPRDIRLDVVL